MSFTEQQHSPQHYSYVYQTNKINYYFADHISFSIIVLLGWSSNADFDTIPDFLQRDKCVDEKLQLKGG